MKKIILFVLLILFIPLVTNAEPLRYFTLGDYAMNGDVIYLSQGNIKYLDGNQVLCEKTINNSQNNLYTVNCDKGRLWELVADDNNNLSFKKIELKANNNVYRLNGSDNYTFKTILKKGDVLLYDGTGSKYLNYPVEGYSSQPKWDSTEHSWIVVGYETPDWTKEIDNSAEEYMLVGYYYSSSSSGGFTFMPYDKPKFSITCDKKQLQKNEETHCSLNVKCNYNLNNISLKLITDKINIVEYKDANTKYEFSIDGNNIYFSLVDEGSDIITGKDNEEQLIKFIVRANDNINSTEQIKAENIKYKLLSIDGTDTASYEFVNNINVPKTIKNPRTSNTSIILIVIISTITLGILIILRKKKISYDI